MADEPIDRAPGGAPDLPDITPGTGPEEGPSKPGPDIEPPKTVPEVGPDVWPGPQPEKEPEQEQLGVARKQFKIALGAVVAIAIVVGLYFANQYLIAPATKVRVHASPLSAESGPHPDAPGFDLQDLSGQKINLDEYKGKVVLLDFWATWCGPCRIEIPSFVELENRYRDQGFAIIGISLDDGPEPVRDFYKQFKMNYPVAMGDDKVSELYGGILGLPTSFLIGRDGRIYAKHVGATDPSVFESEVQQLLGAKSDGPPTDFKQIGMQGPEDKIEVSTPEEVNSEVPGVKLSKFSESDRKAYEASLAKQNCSCGCKLTLLRCRQIDRSCGISLKAARDLAQQFGNHKPDPSAITSPAADPAPPSEGSPSDHQRQ